MTVEFTVPGIPAPGGSKRFVGFGKRTGRAILIDDAGQRNKDWRTAVAWAATEAFGKTKMLVGALNLEVTFFMPRPKGHRHATGKKAGGLRANAPAYPITKPDTTKLLRSTEDALKGIAWNDDSQVVRQRAYKDYADGDIKPGAVISISELEVEGFA